MARRRVRIVPDFFWWRVQVDGREMRVRVVRHPQARRYILRLEEDGIFQVTLPVWGTEREVKEFLRSSVEWMERALAARPGIGQDLQIGDQIPLRGQWVRLERDPEHPEWVCFGDQRVLWDEGDPNRLSLKEVIARQLQETAKNELPPRVRQYAAVHGLKVQRIRIGDQRTRWGSCSDKGTISLNWRLILVPPFVRDYLILHELTHLRVPGHGSAFRAELRRLCPYWQVAEKWIRKEGQRLLWLFPPKRVRP